MKTRQLTLASLFTALVFLVTRFLQVPIPLGYFNVGNSIILLACILMPSPYGVAAGAIGSALADLTSFPIYTVPTLIIKALMPVVFYAMTWKLKESGEHKKSLKVHVAAASVSTLIPLFGYTFTGMILYGNFVTGLAQFPGLLVEYAANIVLFVLLRRVFLSAHLIDLNSTVD
ncbi:MAG: ECF transporter S component [Lachnospiraceae bacterium]|nr:ECF transporter S component [Lachnospiraceae bacterium]